MRNQHQSSPTRYANLLELRMIIIIASALYKILMLNTHVQDTVQLFEVLQFISATVMTIDSRLTQVVTAIEVLTDRQDKVEAKLDQLARGQSHQEHSIAPQRPAPVPASQQTTPVAPSPIPQPPPAATARFPIAPSPLPQPPPAPLYTSAFDSPSVLWYENPSFIKKNQENSSRDYLDHAAVMSLRNNSSSRKKLRCSDRSMHIHQRRAVYFQCEWQEQGST